MKKFIRNSVIIAALCIVTLVGLVGCKDKKTQLDFVKENISYMHKNISTASTDSADVILTQGVGGEQFIADGKVELVADFAKLKYMPKETIMLNKTFSYKLIGDLGEVSGEFAKEPLGAVFSAMIQDASAIGVAKEVIIMQSDTATNFTLQQKMKDCITGDAALKIAYETFVNELSADFDGKTFGREVFVKFINDPSDVQSNYFWYVAFIKGDSNYLSALIDPKTGEVVTTKK